MKYKYVIIGSGFAGRTVASYLKDGEYVILERGENKSYGDIINEYQRNKQKGLRDIDAEEHAYKSLLPWNAVPKLSRFSYSRYALIGGGSSNWWGGKASRISSQLFEQPSPLEWPISYSELREWYKKAEARLNVSGDPLYPTAPPSSAIEGTAYWRTAFSPFFQPSYVYNVAINKSKEKNRAQGLCSGRGHCAVCKEDSKARPENIFPEMNIIYNAFVMSINFDGETAVSCEVYDGKQIYSVEFEHLIIAANGIETPRLLHRSNLPVGVPKEKIGRYLQDHAHLEFDCWINKPIAYGALGGLTHFQIKELSKFYPTTFGNIEASALALTHEPPRDTFFASADLNVLEAGGEIAFRQQLKGTFRIHIELEIPPSVDISVDLQSEEPKVDDGNYNDFIPELEKVESEMRKLLASRGVKVLRSFPHYKRGYGGHHFVGTVNWSKGDNSVIDNQFCVLGTSNVYIAGASIIPRVGGVAPTLTLVALAERLGCYLKELK